jgi:hypothetical protein
LEKLEKNWTKLLIGELLVDMLVWYVDIQLNWKTSRDKVISSIGTQSENSNQASESYVLTYGIIKRSFLSCLEVDNMNIMSMVWDRLKDLNHPEGA